MESDLKSRTLPLRLAVAVPCVRILSGFLSIKLQILLFSAEHPQSVHEIHDENDRSEKIYSCFVGPTMALISRSIGMPVHHASALRFPQWNMMGID